MNDVAPSPRSRLTRVYGPVVVAVFFLTWLKGFRFPNLWAATHFAFNYSQGFVRRGLVGEVARQLLGERAFSYNTFVIFALGVFMLVCFALGRLILRALRSDAEDLALKVAIVVFAASPGLIFFVHAVGYNDYLGVLLVLGVLFATSRRHRSFAIFYWVVGLSIVSALIHEGLAVMFGPVLVLAMGCHILRRASFAPLSSTTWLLLIGHAAVATLILLSLSSLVSLMGSEEAERILALQKYVVEHADFPIRPKAFQALQRSSKEALMQTMPWYWSLEGHWVGALQSWKAFFPGYLWLLVYGLFAVRRAPAPEGSRWILATLFVAASTAPLFFNLVAWDWGRWNGLALMASFISLLTLKLYFPTQERDDTPIHLLSTGVIVAALGLASTTPLFDNFTVQFFPFTAHEKMLETIIQDGFQYRPLF